MSINLRLSHKALILVAVPLVFEFVFVGSLVFLLQQAEYETRKQAHMKAVISESYTLLNSFINSAMSLYLYRLTQQQSFRQQYEYLTQSIPMKLHSLKIMLKDNPKQSQALDRILRVSNRGTALLQETCRLADEGAQANQLLDQKSEIDSVSLELLNELRVFVKEQEKQEDFDPQAEARSRSMIRICLLIGILLNVILAVALAIYFNRGTTKRLEMVMQNTRLLAEGKALAEPLSGADEIGHLDRTFHDMAKALDLSAQRKKELISIVSHELRTPLTSVQATLTSLSHGLMGELSAKAQKSVGMAEKNTVRLIKLINDLLDIERMEAGKIDLKPAPIALEIALERSLDAVLPFAGQNQIDIDMEGTKLWALADEDRLVQVLINLLSNAIKFSPPNGVVKVTVSEKDDDVEVCVADSGRGVPDNLKESIFERYSQVEKADSKKGTGLGLPICKAIIEGHGGQIGIRDNANQGSNFWFRIKKASPH